MPSARQFLALSESPDNVIITLKSGGQEIIANAEDGDAVTFGFYNGVLYTSDEDFYIDWRRKQHHLKQDNHAALARAMAADMPKIFQKEDDYGMGLQKPFRELLAPCGRVWMRKRIVSFWQPPTPEQVSEVCDQFMMAPDQVNLQPTPAADMLLASDYIGTKSDVLAKEFQMRDIDKEMLAQQHLSPEVKKALKPDDSGFGSSAAASRATAAGFDTTAAYKAARRQSEAKTPAERWIWLGAYDKGRTIGKRVGYFAGSEEAGETPTHAGLGVWGEYRWRYREGTPIVFWWEDEMADVEGRASVEAWLEKKGMPVTKHKQMLDMSPEDDFAAGHSLNFTEDAELSTEKVVIGSIDEEFEIKGGLASSGKQTHGSMWAMGDWRFRYVPGDDAVFWWDFPSDRSYAEEVVDWIKTNRWGNPYRHSTLDPHEMFRWTHGDLPEKPEVTAGYYGESARIFLNLFESFDIYEFFDRTDTVKSQIVSSFLANPKGKLSLRKIPASLLSKVWIEFGKYHRIDENGLDKIAECLMDGIAALRVCTQLYGHTDDGMGYYEMFEELMGWDREETDANVDEEDLYEFLAVGDDGDGAFMSDYGLAPLEKLVPKIGDEENPEERLYAIDKALNVVHQRSDLSAFFVQGGQKTLLAVANQGGYYNEDE